MWSINIDRSKKGTSHLYRTKPSITMGRMVYSTLIWFWAMYSLDPRVLKMKSVDRLRDRKGVGDGLVLTTRTSGYRDCLQLPACSLPILHALLSLVGQERGMVCRT